MLISDLCALLKKADQRHHGCMIEFYHVLNYSIPVRGRITYGMEQKQIEFYNEREMERVLRSLASPRGKIR